jgi:hypothetical protein
MPSETPPDVPSDETPMSEGELRERQDYLVRQLTVEQNTHRLQVLSDELEAVQRYLERVRNR